MSEKLPAILLTGLLLGSPAIPQQGSAEPALGASKALTVTELRPSVDPQTPGHRLDLFGEAVALDGDTLLVGAGDRDRGFPGAGSAVVFERSDGEWLEVAELLASDAAAFDRFGRSVALEGDLAVVAAPGVGELERGTAYVFERDMDGNWSETAQLLASDGGETDRFGSALALDGDRLLIAADRAAAVYVFDRDGGGTWNESAKLTASDGGLGFSASIALSGDRALIGAPGDRAAYVFDRDGGGSWGQTVKLTDATVLFGKSVSLDGDRALIAAGDPLTDPGSALVYDRDGGSGLWLPSATLTAAGGEPGDRFGDAVVLDGDRALIGAPGDEDSGRLYVFDRDGGGSWTPSAPISAADGAFDDDFGAAVALSGDRLAAGAPGDDDGGLDSGAAYVFDRDGSDWPQSAQVHATATAADEFFGYSVSLSGDRILVGVRSDPEAANQAGAAYVFERDPAEVWIFAEKLLASDIAGGDWFGFSVALDGNRALIGAYRDDDAGNRSGSAYVFDYDGVGWQESAKLVAPDAAAEDYFGYSVALSGDRALIGAWRDDDGGSEAGSVYVFQRVAGMWSFAAKVLASDAAGGEQFGFSVALDGDRALIGAPEGGDPASGAAYVFDRDPGGSWPETARLAPPVAEHGADFGSAVALSGERALIGAFKEDGATVDEGSAYVFDHAGGGIWNESARLTKPDAEDRDWFGRALALDGDSALIGIPGDDDGGDLAGTVQLFHHDGGGVWSEVAGLPVTTGAENDELGHAVALASGTAALGVPMADDYIGGNSGVVYLFGLPRIFTDGFESGDTSAWSRQWPLLSPPLAASESGR